MINVCTISFRCFHTTEVLVFFILCVRLNHFIFHNSSTHHFLFTSSLSPTEEVTTMRGDALAFHLEKLFNCQNSLGTIIFSRLVLSIFRLLKLECLKMYSKSIFLLSLSLNSTFTYCVNQISCFPPFSQERGPETSNLNFVLAPMGYHFRTCCFSYFLLQKLCPEIGVTTRDTFPWIKVWYSRLFLGGVGTGWFESHSSKTPYRSK